MEISDKKLIKSKIFFQPLENIWEAWTTHEGLKKFFGKDNFIELIPGGAFEIYFLMDNPVGLRGSEGCRILSFLPKKILSFSWNVPPQFEDVRNSVYHTWVVIEFIFVSEHATRIMLTHLGWPTDEKWNVVYDYFDKAWDTVFTQLSALNDTSQNQVPKRATGVGGIFFKSKDPVALKSWYQKHLGFNTDQYGTNFEWRHSDDPARKGHLQWSPFKDTTTYFAPSEKDYMFNYIVEDMENLVTVLRNEGVVVLDEIEKYDYGNFVHILDPEGNKIELWEPVTEVYDELVVGRTK